MAPGAVIFVLGASALPLAERLKTALGGRIHGPRSIAATDHTYEKATAHLQALFRSGRTIIGLCASGILIRALGALLSDKHTEPPVIAVSEDGSSIVPLLGGHHGANELARQIAKITGGHPAITTASDAHFGAALDEPPRGYVLANAGDVKNFAAALLAGDKVRIQGDAPWFAELPKGTDGELEIIITEKNIAGSSQCLVYHPKTLTVGLGCERGTSTSEMLQLIEGTLKVHNLSNGAIACFASIDLKEDETAIHEAVFQTSFRVPRFFSAAELAEETPRLRNPSNLVLKEVGAASVAEAAALRAAGSDAELIVEKTKSQHATIAIARASSPILELRGREAGILHVVGLGPGGRRSRTPEASDALRLSSDWVGYDLYLDLAVDLKINQIEHRFPLGAEEERVRHAIALAKEGKQVALISSGDPGIYAMASLVYEILDREPTRIAVNVIPGISALQAAAAQAGAFIGHDFCCISLSDLLTPWDTIERRVRAAAEGDFVTAFYNPRSEKRRDHLDRAVAILRHHRPAETPVVIASNLGRKDERTAIVALGEFDSSNIDMLTIVLVGSSQSRSFRRGDGRTYAYTPRGYRAKHEVSA
jgi:cobalt-precorrin 5A hydrolase/precorrin-3B C17-methyltransferase